MSHPVSMCGCKCWTLAVLSAEVVAKRHPSGETWQDRMAPWWASMSCSFSPLSMSHILEWARKGERDHFAFDLKMLLDVFWVYVCVYMCELHLDSAVEGPGQQSCVSGWIGEQGEVSDLFLVTLQYFTLPWLPPPHLQRATERQTGKRNLWAADPF